MIPKIHPSNFTWQLWKSGSLYDLGIKKYRTEFIVERRKELRKYAIGYCKAESLVCRPKSGCAAVMFQKDEILFWTHLLDIEFELCFRS